MKTIEEHVLIKYVIMKFMKTCWLVTILCYKAALEMTSLEWMFWIVINLKSICNWWVTCGGTLLVYEQILDQTFENF